MSSQISIDRVPKNQVSISFTWDDNAIRHDTIIAPLFAEQGLKCTFYINPGEPDFNDRYRDAYVRLAKSGFEIGSHSYRHQYMTTLSQQMAENEINNSIQKILENTGSYPITFAFPNHDCNEMLIKQVLNHHLEVRNSLTNSVRFSIKTDTSVNQLKRAVEDAISNNINLVFSGHSIITEDEKIRNVNGEGYQPMQSSVLAEFLVFLSGMRTKVDIVSFSKAAIREWIKRSAVLENDNWIIGEQALQRLEKFGITQQYLSEL